MSDPKKPTITPPQRPPQPRPTTPPEPLIKTPVPDSPNRGIPRPAHVEPDKPWPRGGR